MIATCENTIGASLCQDKADVSLDFRLTACVELVDIYSSRSVLNDTLCATINKDIKQLAYCKQANPPPKLHWNDH